MPARNKKRRRAPKTKKKRSLLKVALIFTLILVLSILGWKVWLSWKKQVWDVNTRITIVAAGENPTVYSYNPQTQKLLILKIPKNTQLATAYGYGDWMAQSLWDLGKQEKMNGELLRLSLQKSLQIPVDAWTNEAGSKLFDGNPLGWFSSLWEAIFVGKVETNLTFFDRFHVLTSLSKVRSADRYKVELDREGVLVKTKLQDGAEAYTVIPDQAKVFFSILRDDLVAGESKKVVIINATSKTGLAGQVANISSTLGARVIGTQSQDEEKGRCKVIGEEKQIGSLTARRLSAVFNCEVIEKEPLGSADLEIILGEEFAKTF